jgi:hypothetical protein
MVAECTRNFNGGMTFAPRPAFDLGLWTLDFILPPVAVRKHLGGTSAASPHMVGRSCRFAMVAVRKVFIKFKAQFTVIRRN